MDKHENAAKVAEEFRKFTEQEQISKGTAILLREIANFLEKGYSIDDCIKVLEFARHAQFTA